MAGPSRRARRARAQPEGRLPRPPARQPDRLHGPLGLGEVEPRLRHDLRGGAAPLRGEPVGLRPAVPGADGQARRRPDRGPLAGRVHRPEVHEPQPAVHRRDDHGGVRLPAPAVEPGGRAALPPLRAPPSRARRPSRSSTRSWSCPRAPASRCWRRWCGAARASSWTCSASCRCRGFSRARVDGETHLLTEPPRLDKKFTHRIEVVVDRLAVKPTARRRLTDSVETALRLADGLVVLDLVDRAADGSDGERELQFSEHLACLHDGLSFEELEPRSFSFNSPYGACGDCTGIGTRMEVDPELVVPDPDETLAGGAVAPWSTATTRSTSGGCWAGWGRPWASGWTSRGAASPRPSRRRCWRATTPRSTSATPTGTAGSAPTTPASRASCRSWRAGTPRRSPTPAGSAWRATCGRCPARRAAGRG